ncbi:MAG: hypothetical protein V4864_00595 [Pseudomonadota bacterium]
MPNQEQSRDGIARKDADRPSPDVERNSTDGQSSARGKGAGGDERPLARGDGPGKIGLTSDAQPDLVSPSGVNERDHGAAADKPMAGGSLNFDDDDMVHPRGKVTGQGRTSDEAKPSDAGDLGAPNAGLSDRNGPSDPNGKDIGFDPGDPSAKKVG